MTNNVIDTYNVVTGSIVAVLSYVLGEHWFLFIAYLGLNVADRSQVGSVQRWQEK